MIRRLVLLTKGMIKTEKIFFHNKSVNAYPSFLNVFGIKAPDGSLNIPPSWQNGISGATNVGEVIGLQVS